MGVKSCKVVGGFFEGPLAPWSKRNKGRQWNTELAVV